MQARVDTIAGPRVWRLRSARDIETACEHLADASYDDIARGRAPRWARARVRYAREGPRWIEDWKRAARVARDGSGDCEDLAAYRVADLRVDGIDAHPIAVRTRDGTVHMMVDADGVLLDPSRARGMGGNKMRYRVTREGPLWRADLDAPGSEIGWTAYGDDPADALQEVILAADDDAGVDVEVGFAPLLGLAGAGLAGSLLGGGGSGSGGGGLFGSIGSALGSAFGSLFGRRQRRRQQRGGAGPVVIPDSAVQPGTQSPPRPAVQHGPDNREIPPVERTRLATAGALALGARDAREGDEEAWRALATIARILERHGPRSRWAHLIRALLRTGEARLW